MFVTMVNTLAYSTKPNLVFSEINRILKPKGRLIFNFSFIIKGKPKKSKFSNELLPNTRNLTPIKLERILKKTDFSIYLRHTQDKKNTLDNQIIQTVWFGLLKNN